MRIAVIGGTGVAGRATVEALQATDHEVIGLSRATGVDLHTGAGLPGALEGVDVVVDTTNVMTMKAGEARAWFERSARNLVDAAATAGVGHLVVLSIVGIDRVPLGYYQGKVRQEEVLGTAPMPVTILRCTQFHEFPGQLLDRSGRLVVVPRWRTQPVAVREVGEALASLATHPPAGRQELAGPAEEDMADLVRRVAAARGERRWIVPVRLPGALGRALATGGAVPDRPGLRGTQGFTEWLAEQSAAAQDRGASA